MSTKQATEKKVTKKDTTKSAQAGGKAKQTAATTGKKTPAAKTTATKAASKTAPKSKSNAAGAAKTAAKKGGAKAAPKKAAAPAKKAPAKKAPAKKAAKPAPKKQTGGDGENKPNTRYFKAIVEGGEAHGRFSGAKPKQAANKALTSILKSKEQKGGSANGEIKFTIVECTRGSKHKEYHYVGKREKLSTPMKVKIGSGPNAKEIVYKFNNRVMKDKNYVVKA